jgi:ABC-type transport system involved in multi-copper enzyme maturation permease subunit
VARYTFVELYKSKILINVALLSFALLFFTYIASEFSYGNSVKIALDFGQGLAGLSAVAIAIFMGVNLITKEIENRTVYMVLSRPINRGAFLFGRLLGMSALLIINVLIVLFFSYTLYFFLGGKFDDLLVWSTIFTCLEALIVLQVVVLFSLITNQILSVINTITVFVLGHAIGAAQDIKFVSARPMLSKFIDVYSYVFPDFSRINIKDFLIYNKTLEFDYLFGALSYGVTYLMVILLLSVLIFKNKNLD